MSNLFWKMVINQDTDLNNNNKKEYQSWASLIIGRMSSQG